MKIEPILDRPGHATVDLGFELGSELVFSLQEERPDGRYLGKDGTWHPSPQWLLPQSVLTKDGATRFTIGPKIVNNIDEELVVLFSIRGAGRSEEVIWPTLPHSAERGTDNPFADGPGQEADDEDEPTSDLPVPGAEAPKSDEAAPAGAETAAEDSSPDKEPEEDSTAPAAAGKGRSRSRLWLAALLIVLLAGAGVGAWYARTSPTTAPEQPSAPADPVLDGLRAAREQLKELVSSRGDLERIVQSSVRLFESGRPEFTQDGLRGLQAAASRGSAAAQMKIAEAFDPRYFAPDRNSAVAQPNADLAADYYFQAEQAGEPRGGDELRNLCADLRRRGGESAVLPQPCRD